ncbi:MAG: tRNA (adenosine(37)-N6)-threonylcarbamoyltransferase complex ATPase subunit type 1 TsaE [Pseudomonadota bacterium]|nr:tRNA (adenosine(37)-N6)-threonylcarbamoyltransferase complex ATPase subunit type 1 TsaE [Pseudomonadota bacterium]
MKDELEINLKNLNDTKKLAEKIANVIKPKTFISLRGKLGTGKTTFVRFLVNFLSIKKVKVLSPTFSLVHTYELKNLKIWHYDLYRLNNKNDIFDLDFDIALLNCVIVEWPEIIEEFLPKDRIEILFDDDRNYRRKASLRYFYKKKLKKGSYENNK